MEQDKRLIDANALYALENLDYVYDPVRDGCEWYRAADVWTCIEREPTVDAVEVVHGKWIHASNKPGVLIGMKCSLCGARIKYSEFINGNHKYCHKCGARMDGDGNG